MKIVNLALFAVMSIVCFLVAELVFRAFHCCYLNMEIDEETYWRASPSQRGYLTFGSESASIDGSGHRLDRLNTGTHTILFLGDSFTFGQSVRDNETFAFLIEQRFSYENISVNVINMAMPGWGPYQILRDLNSSIDAVHPDIIVLVVSEFDLKRQKMPEQESYFTQRTIQSLFGRSQVIRFLFDLFCRITGNNLGNTRNFVESDTLNLWQSNEAVFNSIHDLSIKQQAQLYIIQFPSHNDSDFTLILQTYCQTRDITCIFDLEEYFRPIPSSALYIDGHPSAQAHYLISDIVFPVLRRNLHG